MDGNCENKKAAKAGIGYIVGNVLLKGITFLSVPIFSRIMSQAEFGVYNVFTTYDSILCVVIGLAMHSSIQSANLEFRGKIDEYTSSISIIYFILTGALILFSALFSRGITVLLDFSMPIVCMLILFSFASAISSLYNSRLAIEYRYKEYITLSLINAVASIILSIWLMYSAFSEHKDVGRIVGMTVSLLILATVMIVLQYRKSLPRFNKEYWRFGIKYSLPIVPHGICQVLLAQFDRIMIRTIVGDAAAGLYSLPANIKMVLTIITVSISTAWTTWFYGKIEKGEMSEIRNRSKLITAGFTIITIGLLSISPELVYLLGGASYMESKYAAIPMIVDGFVLFLYNIIIPGEYYKKKTIFIMLGTLIATTINIITNLIFIPRYGYIAAAYTTLFSYVCYLLLHLFICRKIIGTNIIPIKWLLFINASVVAVAVVDILFIDILPIRWFICALIVIPSLTMIVKSYKQLKD